MAKVTFASLKLKNDDAVKTFTINDKEVEVKQYLPIQDKYDLIMVTLQESMENGYYNPIKEEVYFSMNIVFMYTNLTFTDKQKEDINKLYDILEQNNIFNKVIGTIPSEEYTQLLNSLKDAKAELINYNKSFAGIVNGLLETFTMNNISLTESLNNIDIEKYQNVIKLAQNTGIDN